MSVMGRVKGGFKSAAGSAWVVTKKLLVRVAIAAAIMVVAIALARHGESAASEIGGMEEASGTEAHPIAAQRAILSEGWTDEQLFLCNYTVDATFGVSIFTETDWSSRRLARVLNGTELEGSCMSTTGEKSLGCNGLEWETEWIHVRHGDTVGYTPASCLVSDGIF
ncbi:hypothetical protein [Glycomyces niveus]|uniref:SH3 domain-containing protein n=1 Tax=Glycomyces niveus TaxID=2820287 RepID=A0ABS3U3T9_9ACTN|nr:hypothetical protein [Glycomyces sp. NEAU-S30]MBO3733437.1 hypothetical protein [Glycomyces sp. NEAU-S30]